MAGTSFHSIWRALALECWLLQIKPMHNSTRNPATQKNWNILSFFLVEFFSSLASKLDSTQKFYLKLKHFSYFFELFNLFQVEFDYKCSIKTWKSLKIEGNTILFRLKLEKAQKLDDIHKHFQLKLVHT